MRRELAAAALATIGAVYAAFPPTAGAVDDLQVLPDGGILVTSDANYLDRQAVAILRPDGSIDTSFGGDGFISVLGGLAAGAQRDGKVVVVASRRGSGFVHRYRASGAVDRGFARKGKDGVLRLQSEIAEVTPQDVAVRANGEIAVPVHWQCHGGTRGCGYTYEFIHLWRFDAKGRSRGYGAVNASTVVGMSLAPGRKTLLTGRSNESDWEFTARFNRKGKPDKTFSKDGNLTFPGDESYGPQDVVAQSDGSSVVAGYRGLTSLTAKGGIDTAFGAGGVATCPTPLPPPSTIVPGFDAVAVQPDQRLLAVSNLCGLSRFTPTGQPDASFAGGEAVPVPKTSSLTLPPRADVALQPDGRIVTAVFDNQLRTFQIARILADGAPDASFGSGGTVTVPVP